MGTSNSARRRPTSSTGKHPHLHVVPLPSDAPAGVSDNVITLHGHRMPYLEAGQRGIGPTVVLIHGLGGDRWSWLKVVHDLSHHAHVVVPDLLGFGDADKPHHGDYSVLAHAARIRDLIVALELDQVGVIGHSFGGGVAMSFVYQFPERAAMLGLICSGGLGPEVATPLRLATVPSATWLAHTVHARTPQWVKGAIRHVLPEMGMSSRAEIDAVLNALDSLRDPAAREAYLRTLRDAVNWNGQRITATDRLHLLATLPTLLVAGRRDQCIPSAHTTQTHHQLPDSELAVLDTGHFPHHERPHDVAHLIANFVTGLAAVPNAATPA